MYSNLPFMRIYIMNTQKDKINRIIRMFIFKSYEKRNPE